MKQEVAKARQVIAITHLAPVAAQAGAHYAVSKHVEDGRTVTGIERVEGEARVEEMTRILGGETADGEARKLAEALLRGNRASTIPG
jgi:DNA repair protein RecN (Recombination protein N)